MNDDDNTISKQDKHDIANRQYIESVGMMTALVVWNHSAYLGIFPYELVLAICWEESFWQNIQQFGGGPAVGYGQLEQGGIYKANQHYCQNYSIFPTSPFTKGLILGSQDESVRACSYCLAGLYEHPALGHDRDATLNIYAGVSSRPANKPIPKRWKDCADALSGLALNPTSMTIPAIEDGLRIARDFPRTGAVYDHIHSRLFPLVEIIGNMIDTMQQGDSGPQVSYLQDSLNRVPFDEPWSSSMTIPLKVDGEFGSKTAARVQRFQEAYSLEPDGIAGPLTITALSQAAMAVPA